MKNNFNLFVLFTPIGLRITTRYNFALVDENITGDFRSYLPFLSEFWLWLNSINFQVGQLHKYFQLYFKMWHASNNKSTTDTIFTRSFKCC